MGFNSAPAKLSPTPGSSVQALAPQMSSGDARSSLQKIQKSSQATREAQEEAPERKKEVAGSFAKAIAQRLIGKVRGKSSTLVSEFVPMADDGEDQWEKDSVQLM